MPRRARLAFAAAVAAVLFASCSTSPALSCPAPPSPSTCPSLDGVTTFCTWAQWGCAREQTCGGYYAIVDMTVDGQLTYYYAAATGQFVATVAATGGGGASCVVGPSRFQVPQGCGGDTLADCAPPPREGGVGPVDAAVDAPFTAPSPSGSPSSQPLAAPPSYPPR